MGFAVWGPGSRNSCFGLMAQCVVFRVQALEFKVNSILEKRCRGKYLGYMVWSSGFKVRGSRLGVWVLESGV